LVKQYVNNFYLWMYKILVFNHSAVRRKELPLLLSHSEVIQSLKMHAKILWWMRPCSQGQRSVSGSRCSMKACVLSFLWMGLTRLKNYVNSSTKSGSQTRSAASLSFNTTVMDNYVREDCGQMASVYIQEISYNTF